MTSNDCENESEKRFVMSSHRLKDPLMIELNLQTNHATTLASAKGATCTHIYIYWNDVTVSDVVLLQTRIPKDTVL